MKTKTAIAACMVLACMSFPSFSQTASSKTKEHTKKENKIDKKKIPKEVTETFVVEYPTLTYDTWYGYPNYDYGNDWFDDWYNDNPYYDSESIESPDYYVVEYSVDNMPQKTVYKKSGKKVATHRMMKSDLPKSITDAINKSQYKTWTLGKDKEEIFKDKDSDQMKVYKIHVSKDKEKHTLYYQSDGKLLKDKKTI